MEPVNVFVRSEDVDENVCDDIWDDELLIKAYNKSVKGIKQKIAQRMGLSNGSPEDVKDEEVNKKSGKKVQNSMKKGQGKKKWDIGDYCRAVYSEDGLEYEGQIINLLPDGQCVVKYSGYNNDETVKIKNLRNSLGEKSRSAQKYAARGQSDKKDTKLSENFGENNFSKISMPSFPGIPAVPPPPAFNLSSQFNHENESDALSAMLMSWYMSGYHTGYYQGLMHAKKHPSSCNK